MKLPLAAAVAGSLMTIAVGVAWAARENVTAQCRAIDGDTIVCGVERIRLAAIDAPEMPGHCRPGRQCLIGDPYSSRDALDQIVRRGDLTAERWSKDRYGRTVADVRWRGRSLSCEQVWNRRADYWPKYDRDGRIKKECGL